MVFIVFAMFVAFGCSLICFYCVYFHEDIHSFVLTAVKMRREREKRKKILRLFYNKMKMKREKITGSCYSKMKMKREREDVTPILQ